MSASGRTQPVARSSPFLTLQLELMVALHIFVSKSANSHQRPEQREISERCHGDPSEPASEEHPKQFGNGNSAAEPLEQVAGKKGRCERYANNKQAPPIGLVGKLYVALEIHALVVPQGFESC